MTRERPLCRRAIATFGLRLVREGRRTVAVYADGRRAFVTTGLLRQLRKQAAEEDASDPIGGHDV